MYESLERPFKPYTKVSYFRDLRFIVILPALVERLHIPHSGKRNVFGFFKCLASLKKESPPIGRADFLAGACLAYSCETAF